MKLTKKTIEKLYAAPVEVSLWNGNFNRARVRITNNKVDYELYVDDTHQLLHEFSICKWPRTTFVVWGSPYSGQHANVPESLKGLELKLLEAAKMSDEYGQQLQQKMVAMVIEFLRDMGW